MTPRIGVDVGGTFTDVTLVTDTNDLVTAKVPSTTDQSRGVMAGIRKACEKADLDPSKLQEFTHATTVSVNALLERNGARTALVTTEGFGDVLEIGRQTRPELYDLDAEQPSPLVPRARRYEITERTRADGTVRPVDETEVRELAATLRDDDVESVAVVLLHSYTTPDNERRVVEILRDELDVPISASYEVLSEFREFERTATTTVDAYVTPTIEGYLGRLIDRAASEGIPEPRIMQSNGGVANLDAIRDRAVATTLSGPAAGVVGAGRAAREVGQTLDLAGLVTFDMGGTSSDVSLIRDGEAERTTAMDIDGIPVRIPMVDVNTIGSGGGSIAWIDQGGALRVGPRSAGADPGPACYGKGGTDPTVTDANLVLGYVGESTALGGELSLDYSAAETAFDRLATEAGLESPIDAARGVYRVANAKMTQAIREVTVERGYDPRSFGLVAFGGAGPMHAAPVADNLDIETVIVPMAGGVLSSYGLLDADEQYDRVRTHLVSLADADPDTVETILDDLTTDALDDVSGTVDAIEYEADLRYAGQSFELTIPIETPFDPTEVRERFNSAHERTYGYTMDMAVELVNLRSTVKSDRSVASTTYEEAADSLLDTRQATFGEETYEAEIHERRALAIGRTLSGPAILEQAESTTVVPPSWTATAHEDGTVVLERQIAQETN